jgi:hypothetical protein
MMAVPQTAYTPWTRPSECQGAMHKDDQWRSKAAFCQGNEEGRHEADHGCGQTDRANQDVDAPSPNGREWTKQGESLVCPGSYQLSGL